MAIPGLYGDHENSTFRGDGSGNSSYEGRVHDLVAFLRQQLDAFSKQQRQLANAREKLFMQRERLRSYGKILRAQREKTGSAEEAFMNEVRRYWNEQSGQTSLPPPIQESYQLVQQERDQLGVAEDDWIQAERKFGGAEWEFIEKETTFYEHDIKAQFSDSFFESLVDKLRPPPQQPTHLPEPAFALSTSGYQDKYESELSRLQELRKEFNSMRKPQARYIDERRSHKLRQLPLSLLPKQDPVFIRRYEDLLTEIADSEVKVQQLKQKMMQTDNLAHVMKRRTSEPLTPGQQKYSLTSLRRVQTEGGLSDLLDNFSDTKGRIREWLLDYLKNNAVEKRQYREILRYFGAPDLEEDHWQDSWDKDLSENYELDSFPRQSLSHPTSDRVDSTEQIDTDDLPTLQHKTKFQMDFEDNFNYAPVPVPPVYFAPIHPPPFPPPIEIAPVSPVSAFLSPTSLIPSYSPYDILPYPDSDSENEPPPVMIPYYDPDPDRESNTGDGPQRLTVPESSRHDSHHGSEASVTECAASTREQHGHQGESNSPQGGSNPHQAENVPHQAESDIHRDESDPHQAESDPYIDNSSGSTRPDFLPLRTPQTSSAPTINIIDVSEYDNDRNPLLEQYSSESMVTIQDGGIGHTEMMSPSGSEKDCSQNGAMSKTSTDELPSEIRNLVTPEPILDRKDEARPASNSDCLDLFCTPWKLPSPRSSSPLRARPRLERPKSDGCRTPSKKRSHSADMSALARRKSFAGYLPIVQIQTQRLNDFFCHPRCHDI